MNVNMMQKIFIFLFYFIIIFLNLNCSTGSSPLVDDKLSIEPIFIDATKSYFKTTSTNLSDEYEIRLFRDDSLISISKSLNSNIMITDSNLLPGHYYSYYATQHLKNSGISTRSNKVDINTLDTTSQIFDIKTDLFGHIGSHLRDVHIFSPSEIWAVGGIYDGDELYGALIWDGSSWVSKNLIWDEAHIQPNDFFSFNNDKIWLTGGSIFYYQQDSLELSYLRDIVNKQSMSRSWGVSENNLFSVGNHGTILDYDGQEWHNLNINSDDGFIDISGYANSEDDINLWVIGNNSIIYYDGSSWTNLIDEIRSYFTEYFIPTAVFASDKINGVLVALAMPTKSIVFFLSPEIVYPMILFECDIYVRAISATNFNDIFVSGDYLRFGHYNGKVFQRKDDQVGSGYLLGIDMLGDFTIIVGQIPNYTSIIITMTK